MVAFGYGLSSGDGQELGSELSTFRQRTWHDLKIIIKVIPTQTRTATSFIFS